MNAWSYTSKERKIFLKANTAGPIFTKYLLGSLIFKFIIIDFFFFFLIVIIAISEQPWYCMIAVVFILPKGNMSVFLKTWEANIILNSFPGSSQCQACTLQKSYHCHQPLWAWWTLEGGEPLHWFPVVGVQWLEAEKILQEGLGLSSFFWSCNCLFLDYALHFFTYLFNPYLAIKV